MAYQTLFDLLAWCCAVSCGSKAIMYDVRARLVRDGGGQLLFVWSVNQCGGERESREQEFVCLSVTAHI